MMKLVLSALIVMSVSKSFAYDLLNEKGCRAAVAVLAKKSITAVKADSYILPLSHVSITPGTYSQNFISLVQVDDSYYSIVSEGDFDCDYMQAVSVTKVHTRE